MRKDKIIATVSSKIPNLIVGTSDVIRWKDIMKVNGCLIKVNKAVELGIKYKLDIAFKLEKDLKSKTGLLITFPIAYLMDALQREVGSGKKLLELVKANEQTNSK